MSNVLNPGSEHDVTSREEEGATDEMSPEDERVIADEAREGLPRGYRMRADTHYVDQLASVSGGPPVRMLPLGQIESEGSVAQIELRPLIESVRSHGIVHPLLVRRRSSGYAVVAGRRRLAVAHILRLTTVPCLIHELDDRQAAAFAQADNLTTGPANQDPATKATPAAIRQIIADHLATVRRCAETVASGIPAMNRSVLDLIQAHAWRAARLGDALELILNTPPPQCRDRAFSTIADELVDGFRPESRLSDFVLRAHIRDDLSTSGMNARELLAGWSAALIATLPLIEHVSRPTVLIKAAAGPAGSVVMEVAQADASVSTGLARHYFDEDAPNSRPGGYAAVAGALAAKALAERYGGTAAFDSMQNGGSVLKLVLVRRS